MIPTTAFTARAAEASCPARGTTDATCTTIPQQEPFLSSLLRRFERITLAGLEETKAQLMTREESKHLMTFRQVRDLIQILAGSYHVLEIRGKRIQRYDTMYYDTPDFLSYTEHHNGKANRCKLRLRHYDTSGETYLEVKRKTNKGSTEKSRIQTTAAPTGFLPEQAEFLRQVLPYDWQDFHPVVRTVYDRFTLVSATSPERITFDFRLSFDDGERRISYPALVITEVKYERGAKNSLILRKLHEMGIGKRPFSKYCIGASLLYDQLKHNHFKPHLLYLSRFTCGGALPC